MKRPSILLVTLTLHMACAGEPPPAGPPTTAGELLDRAIDYHDPEGAWPAFRHSLVLEQDRPDGSSRRTTVRLNVPDERFSYVEDTPQGQLRRGILDGECFATVDDRPPTDQEAQELGLDCPRIERMRNYYLYLWGLPMKLRDPGTNVDPEIREEVFDGRSTKAIRVTYDPDVGSDTWYFYFAPDDYRMVGYRFYHDESAGDGEYILLQDERVVLGMRIPRVRRWFTNADSTLLGEDRLVEDFQGQPVRR